MYSELSLLVELYNPLYLFPIFGVVFTALIVYAFGFKSSTQPPTEVFDALNDRHPKNYKTHESVKKKKQNQKITPKPEPNGHITSGSVKSAEKKAQKKAVVEMKPFSEPKIKSNPKKVQKNKKSEVLDNRQDIDDKESGEWVELISKKEKKNRKQKEEQLIIESKGDNEKSSDKSPKKGSKKNKIPKNISLDSNLITKPVEETVVEKNDLNSAKTQNGIQSEELSTEETDIYELAKQQRVPKKSQKRNQKRNSESETTVKVEPPLESEPKPNLNLSDKLTASIVANYESTDKTDSNTSNNKKKKEKNKKKVTQTLNQTNNETNDKQVIKNEEKIASIETNETPIEKSNSGVNAIDIPNEIKVSEEEEFKSVGKKRRARRE